MKTLAEQLKGIPALQGDVKLARGLAHASFDRIWKEGWMTRTEAYEWLAFAMEMSSADAHIVNFDAQQCKTVISLANRYLDEVNR